MTPRRARAGLIAGAMAWPAITTALALSARDTAPGVLDGSASPDEAVAALAAALGLAVLGWLAVAVLVGALRHLLPAGGRAALAASRLDRVITPAVLRRFVALAVAGALVSGAAPAQAAARPAAPTVSTSAGEFDPAPLDPASLDPGWLPTITARPAIPPGPALDPGWLPTPSAAPTPAGAPPSGRSATLDPAWATSGRARPGAYPEQEVVVRRGDTLWDIAARHLGAAATDAEIAHAWPRWFTANRSVIGPDPDRLAPGQRLRPPASTPGGLT